jgi:HlyD family secretion protein
LALNTVHQLPLIHSWSKVLLTGIIVGEGKEGLRIVLPKMDRELPITTRQKQARRPWIIGIGILVVAVAAIFAFRNALRPSLSANQVLLTRVEVGDVEATLGAGGVVEPGRETVITAPIASTIRRVLRQPGDQVVPGQPIVELDKELTQTSLAKLLDEQARQQNKTDQLRLTLERTLTDLRSQREVQEAKVGSLRAALRDEQYLAGIGGTTQENVRQAELNLRVAELESRRLDQQINAQKRSAVADQREVGFQLASQARDITDLRRTLRLAEISAEQPGVLTWVNDHPGTTVPAGTELARVADLSTFRVRATISDTYAEALRPGTPVRIRLGGSTDAATDLTGTIATISPAVEKGSMTFTVALTEPDNPALRPQLRVDVFVVTRAHLRTLRVKNGPYFTGAQEQAVYVMGADGRAHRRTVRFGDSNFDWVQIISGLKPGEELLLTETKSLGDAEEVSIEH